MEPGRVKRFPPYTTYTEGPTPRPFFSFICTAFLPAWFFLFGLQHFGALPIPSWNPAG